MNIVLDCVIFRAVLIIASYVSIARSCDVIKLILFNKERYNIIVAWCDLIVGKIIADRERI